jgi:hypothetical protein
MQIGVATIAKRDQIEEFFGPDPLRATGQNTTGVATVMDLFGTPDPAAFADTVCAGEDQTSFLGSGRRLTIDVVSLLPGELHAAGH